MKLECPPRRSIRPVRKGFRVLHGTRNQPRPTRAPGPRSAAQTSIGPSTAGSALAELLISLSILAIAVIGVAAGSRAARLQAELASRRAAEALAAQQVLECKTMWDPAESPVFDTVRIGVHDVEIRTDVRDTLPGIVWLRVQADAGAGRYSWQLESARRIP